MKIRELREETGLIADELHYLGKAHSCPQLTNRVSYLFFTDQILGVEDQELDDEENVNVLQFPCRRSKTTLNRGGFRMERQ